MSKTPTKTPPSSSEPKEKATVDPSTLPRDQSIVLCELDIYDWAHFRPMEDSMLGKLSTDEIEALYELMNSPDTALELRYKCFFQIFHFYRKSEDWDKRINFYKKYSPEFHKISHSVLIPTLNHIHFLNELEIQRSTIYSDASSNIDPMLIFIQTCRDYVNNAVEAGEQEKRITDKDNFKVGILHLYADAFLVVAERHDQHPHPKLNEYLQANRDDAKHKLYTAILLKNNYAKFYQTMARFYLFERNYAEATKNIHLAINKENSELGNYGLLLMNYNLTKQTIIMKQSEENSQKKLSEMMSRMEEVAENVDDSHMKTIEVVGFFTGIISFVISSVQIIGMMELEDAAKLIVLLLGGWIITYSTFSVLFRKPEKRNIIQCVAVAFFGFMLMLGGKYFAI